MAVPLDDAPSAMSSADAKTRSIGERGISLLALFLVYLNPNRMVNKKIIDLEKFA